MIAKIFSAAGNADSAIWYSERKVEKAFGMRMEQDDTVPAEDLDDSHLVAVRNVPDDSTLMDEFDRLEMLNVKTKTKGRKLEKPGFHMVLNPGDSDRRLSENEALELIEKIMNDLGYGDTPYAVYYHDDIERNHYHIAGIRIGQDGKKIEDSFEEERLQKILWDYAKKYGYRVGNQETPEENENLKKSAEQAAKKKNDKQVDGTGKAPQNENSEPKKATLAKKFDRNSETPTTEQLKSIFLAALNWSFSTEEQFMILVRRKYHANIAVNQTSCTIAGNGEDGKPATPPLTSDELGIPMYKMLREQIENFNKKKKPQSRKYVEDSVRWAAEQSDSYDEFKRVLSTKKIYVTISWNKDGRPFGITWIDDRNKQIWKGSETATDLKWLLDMQGRKNWDINAKTKQKVKIKPMKINRVEPSDEKIRRSSKTTEQNTRKPPKKQKDFLQEMAKGGGGGGQHISGSGNLSDDVYEDDTKRRMSATTSVPND